MATLGILFAFGALLSWGIGDFLIQKTVRKDGDQETLFFITLAASVFLFPFIAKDIPSLLEDTSALTLLLFTGALIFIVALLEFEALKRGKISVMEPVLGFELPMTVALSVVFLKEDLSLVQFVLIATAFLGIVLTATTKLSHLHFGKRIVEKGVALAAVGMVGMSLVNFLMGVGSRETSPLMVNWLTSVVMLLLVTTYLGTRKKLRRAVQDAFRNPKLVASVSVIDNAAWIFYAFAVTLIPISIVITISESYIVLASLLGVYINRERLKIHQVIGAALTFASILILSVITSG